MYDVLTNRIDSLLAQGQRVILAIDGPCASGKTTLGAYLEERYDCNLFHMDDFFLRPEQRTPQRFAKPGGNVDYERFRDEVLMPLATGKAFSYRPFDCKTFTLSEPVAVSPKKLTIIEGSYSHHPYFGDPYDLKVFLTADLQTQRQRILERPPFLHQRFFRDWIPMENLYFQTFHIREQAELVLKT